MRFKINLCAGVGIEDAVDDLVTAAIEIRNTFNMNHVELDEEGIITYASFNGTEITSRDTVDEAYVKITGKTKKEADEEERKWREDYERKKREWKEAIPSKIQSYCDMARGIIREDKYDYWDKIVPIRLGDIYQGMELGCTLDILKEWNDSGSYKKCHKIIINQGHSGMSHGLMMSMIKAFARGNDEMVDKLIRTLDKVEYDKNA